MTRKTFEVADLVDFANNLLKSGHQTSRFRWGVIGCVEEVLHATGNYKGYRHLSQNEVPDASKPGIRLDAEGNILPYPARFDDCDATRRQYNI